MGEGRCHRVQRRCWAEIGFMRRLWIKISYMALRDMKFPCDHLIYISKDTTVAKHGPRILTLMHTFEHRDPRHPNMRVFGVPFNIVLAIRCPTLQRWILTGSSLASDSSPILCPATSIDLCHEGSMVRHVHRSVKCMQRLYVRRSSGTVCRVSPRRYQTAQTVLKSDDSISEAHKEEKLWGLYTYSGVVRRDMGCETVY